MSDTVLSTRVTNRTTALPSWADSLKEQINIKKINYSKVYQEILWRRNRKHIARTLISG